MNLSVEKKMEELFGEDDDGSEGMETDSNHTTEGEEGEEPAPKRVIQKAYINTVGPRKPVTTNEFEPERSLLPFPTSAKSPPPAAAGLGCNSIEKNLV